MEGRWLARPEAVKRTPLKLRSVSLAAVIVLVAVLHAHFNRASSGCKDGNCLTPYGELIAANAGK